MPAFPEVKQSFVVQSPSFIFGLKVVAEPVETLIPLEAGVAPLPELYIELAAQYGRLPRIEDASGGLRGDRFPF
jgi:hypothetical protein